MRLRSCWPFSMLHPSTSMHVHGHPPCCLVSSSLCACEWPSCSYGPRQSERKFGFSETGRLQCDVRLSSFAAQGLNKLQQVWGRGSEIVLPVSVASISSEPYLHAIIGRLFRLICNVPVGVWHDSTGKHMGWDGPRGAPEQRGGMSTPPRPPPRPRQFVGPLYLNRSL